jgi:CHRD domain-containing protein
MRGRLLLGLFVLGLAVVTAAVAGVNANWSVHANGSQEVPPRDSQGQAQAIFHLAPDGKSIDYKLTAANIENVFMAHIHMVTTAPTAPGVNGPIVVWLYPSTAVGVQAPLGGGRIQGVIAQGTITKDDLTGPLQGADDLAVLIAAMRDGKAYVNLHTNDGVGATNTGAGDFPGGEIRADISTTD